MDAVRTFSTAEVVGLSGAAYRSLQRWREYGCFGEALAGDRQGEKLRWSAKETAEAVTLTGLRRLGVSMQKMKRVMDYLRTQGFNPLSAGPRAFLVVPGHDRRKPAEVVRLTEDGGGFSLLTSPGQLIMPIILPKELRKAQAEEVSAQ